MRDRVREGRWAAGMMIPSRKSLAQEYGVDLRTVQRAIAALLTDGTLTAHGGRGTFVASRIETNGNDNPVSIPEALMGKTWSKGTMPVWERAQQSRQVIGIVVNQLINPGEIAPRAISGAIHAAARRSSPDLRILNLDSYADSIDAMVRQETDAFNVIEHEGLSGAIVWHSGGEHTLPQLRRIADKGIPLVLIDRYPEGLDCDFVGVDNVFSAVEAVEHLTGLGHVRIGFVAPMENVSAIEERLAGYRKALERASIAHREELEFRLPLLSSLALASLEEEMRKIVRTIEQMPEPPTALFTVNDIQAHHLINALEANGYPVPGRMSVIGFDDIDRYSPRAPFLSTMRQSFESIGERAADLLLQRIAARAQAPRAAGPTTYKHILLPAKLIIRQSCAAPAQADL